jgi:hypothetical protein
MTTRAGTKEFQSMGYILETMPLGQKGRFVDGARFKSINMTTHPADHMMMMLRPSQLKPGWPVTKVTAIYHSKLLKADHCPVDGCRIHGNPFALLHPLLQSLDSERALFVGQEMNDGFAGSCQFESLLFYERQSINLQFEMIDGLFVTTLRQDSFSALGYQVSLEYIR